MLSTNSVSVISVNRLSWSMVADTLPFRDFDIGLDFSVDQGQLRQYWLYLR